MKQSEESQVSHGSLAPEPGPRPRSEVTFSEAKQILSQVHRARGSVVPHPDPPSQEGR